MHKSRRILVIDADPMLGPLTARWLARRGASVTLSSSIAAALETRDRWDAALLDDSCGPVDADAVEALRRVAPRIVSSGAAVPGVALCLAKPHAFERLTNLLLVGHGLRRSLVRSGSALRRSAGRPGLRLAPFARAAPGARGRRRPAR